MSFFSFFKNILANDAKSAVDDSIPLGASQNERDIFDVIKDLSKVVLADEKALDVYMALANLFRSNGEYAKAIRLRESVLVRPKLKALLKAKATLELAEDLRRAGLFERAHIVYADALKLGVSQAIINKGLVNLYADSKDWIKAAQTSALLGNRIAEANFYSREAQKEFKSSGIRSKNILQYLNKALSAYPASPEAGAGAIAYYALTEKWPLAAKQLGKSLAVIDENKCFLLFQEIYNLCSESENEKFTSIEFCNAMANSFIPVVREFSGKLFSHYYTALLFLRCNRIEDASQALKLALDIEPNFWAGRLTELETARHQFSIPSALDKNIDFFTRQMGNVQRFFCSQCNYESADIFYQCPHCQGWHTTTYRIKIDSQLKHDNTI